MTYDVQEVREVGDGQVVDDFVGGDENFEQDYLLNEEPLQVLKDWGDVISLWGERGRGDEFLMHCSLLGILVDLSHRMVLQ